MKTEKLGGVAGGEGECGDDVAGWLVRERRSLDRRTAQSILSYQLLHNCTKSHSTVLQ